MSAYPRIKHKGLIIEPQELFQKDIETHAQSIVHVNQSEECLVVIVGAWRGEEILSFLNWKKCTIFAFEPNKENFSYLHNVYSRNKQVHCFNLACSDTDGFAELFQANLTGNDSLLPIQQREGFIQVSSSVVKTVRLDSVEELKNRKINMLWIDVQGFEKYVLQGAPEVLKYTQCLFVELNDNDIAYKGATRIAELVQLLDEAGFYMAHSEVSVQSETGIKSGMGFFLRKEYQTSFFKQEEIDKRVVILSKKISMHMSLVQTWWYTFMRRIFPARMKRYVKAVYARYK